MASRYIDWRDRRYNALEKLVRAARNYERAATRSSKAHDGKFEDKYAVRLERAALEFAHAERMERHQVTANLK